MTDKRKDEMPKELWIGNYNVESSWDATPNKLHNDDIKYIRADLSPPVPDDVAQVIKRLTTGRTKASQYVGGWLLEDIETLIRYAQEQNDDRQAQG